MGLIDRLGRRLFPDPPEDEPKASDETHAKLQEAHEKMRETQELAKEVHQVAAESHRLRRENMFSARIRAATGRMARP